MRKEREVRGGGVISEGREGKRESKGGVHMVSGQCGKGEGGGIEMQGGGAI